MKREHLEKDKSETTDLKTIDSGKEGSEKRQTGILTRKVYRVTERNQKEMEIVKTYRGHRVEGKENELDKASLTRRQGRRSFEPPK